MGKKPITKEEIHARKEEIMEQCFECYADHGFYGTGVSSLAKYCGCTAANLYTYFDGVDDLIIQSTEHCMSKVEDDFMAKAPVNAEDISRFLDEIPYWTAREHGAKYRLMYQVYTHPKYIEHGKAFFAGVNERYRAYAGQLEPLLGMPREVITPLIFIFVRASVHYAMFEDEYYLKSQMEALKQSVFLFSRQYRQTGGDGGKGNPVPWRIQN